MVNHRRGEIEACLDGRRYRLCLTLGALAELEAAFGSQDMLALAERFASGRLSARDALRIIAAGLRGAGHDATDAEVAAMSNDDGAAGFVGIVAELLRATFGPASGAATEPGTPLASASPLPPEVRSSPRPFPGTR